MKLTTGQVISVATGIMACEIGEIYAALNGLTGDNLMTHQLPDASEAFEDYVRGVCDWVNNIPPLPTFKKGDDRKSVVLNWAGEISNKVGNEHEVASKPELWGTHDALEDAFNKVGAEKVILVTDDTDVDEIITLVSKL